MQRNIRLSDRMPLSDSGRRPPHPQPLSRGGERGEDFHVTSRVKPPVASPAFPPSPLAGEGLGVRRPHSLRSRIVRCCFALAILLCTFCTSSALAAEKVSLENLLPQMTNLKLLSEYPDPPFVTKQFSSYDRASVAPGSESWFANSD